MFSISCKTDQKTPPEESTNFDYRPYLLKDQDRVPFIPLDIHQSQDSIFRLVNTFTGENCTELLRFNTRIENDTIAVNVRQNCMIYCGYSFNIPIIINKDEKILVDYNHSTIEDLSLDIYKLIKEEYNPYHGSLNINFQIQNTSNSAALNKIVYYKAIEGYLDFMFDMSNEKYFKPLYQLTSEELDFLKQSANISLSYREEIDINPPF